MNLKSYINLYELLQDNKVTQEENRAFGLKYRGKPIGQLLRWADDHAPALRRPLLSERFSKYLYGMTVFLGIVALVLGFLSGIGLLSYNGHEPVNMVYFLAMVVFVPLFTMSLTFISMLRANAMQSLLIHISPAFWMEKIFRFLPMGIGQELRELKVNPLLLNWLVIKRAQLLALLFSIGLLLALLGMVVTKDIAFAWSTTLQVSAEEFHGFLNMLSFAWRDILPSAEPSIELIEQSQYFRLGEKLDSSMVQNASRLGEWWKFLFCATIFYAIVLRFVMWALASLGFDRAIKKSILSLDGAEALLMQMNTPIVTTVSTGIEKEFVQNSADYIRVVHGHESEYDIALGWAMSDEDMMVLGDAIGVQVSASFDVGGTNTLDEDSKIISKSHGAVLLYVKSWEPPTMDFVDFLSELIVVVDKVTVCPVGTALDGFIVQGKELDMWARKLQITGERKVWLKI
ncbi:MAG TPA: DUF2868 domain-containing protein [Sulfurovum sp.]|nr:DUF2868 domain-containing protein [Sulfurovum sp.]